MEQCAAASGLTVKGNPIFLAKYGSCVIGFCNKIVSLKEIRKCDTIS
jgi:hypothetical protein